MELDGLATLDHLQLAEASKAAQLVLNEFATIAIMRAVLAIVKCCTNGMA